jgi:AcrR family transcriptional regulator
MPADERRELILAAALTEFSLHGLHGASTKTIAKQAGISQPYLFQLFGSKRALFLAVLDRVFDHTLERLRQAAEGATREDVLTAVGRAYTQQLTEDREGLLAFAQFLAACSDEEVLSALRSRFGDLYHYVERVSGANDEAVRTVFAYAMLAAAAAAMRLDDVATRDSWATRLLGFLHELERD